MALYAGKAAAIIIKKEGIPMKVKKLLIIALMSAVSMIFCNNVLAAKRLVFGGGPAGGTFQIVANSIQVYKPIKTVAKLRVQAQSSAGSLENLRKTNSGQQHMSVVYSSNVYQGRNGILKNDDRKYEDVLAVAWLYGAPAQLVVHQDSGIKSVIDLVGKNVGVGNAGSGAFANCELFFTHMGIWDKIKRNALGYNDAAQAFGNNQLDAFWLFTAFPSGAVMMAAQTNDIDILNLDNDAKKSDFYEKYPYFKTICIPAETYTGVNHDSLSFQDSALWVANSKVSSDTIYKMLNLIFSDEGLAHMKSQKKLFKIMSLQTGIDGIVTPLHPGAEKFWQEKGILQE